MSRWIIFDSGPRSGLENMQLDEWLARSWFPATGISVFRFYSWNPYTVSLGFHQSPEDIDHKKIKMAGYDIVRRPTGGRAVFHAQEITYSTVMDATGISVDAIYERISRVLTIGLKAAGYDVAFAGTKQDFSSLYREKKSVSCFTASSQFEIQLTGRKLVGSAQRRYMRGDGAVTALQHGSILTGPKHNELADFLVAGDRFKEKLKNIMMQSSTDLSENGSKKIDTGHIKSFLRHAVINELAGGNYEECSHIDFLSQMSESNSYSTELI